MTHPVASIILIHGLGASGRDLAPIAQALDLRSIGAVRFIFPNAPVRPVSVCGGERMPAWYDLLAPDLLLREDELGLRDAQTYLASLIDQEVARGIPSRRIVVGGFSQGCAMSLMTGLRYPLPLAGIAGLSGYLSLAGQTGREATEANRATPVFLAHGEGDTVVPLAAARLAWDWLRAEGHGVAWHAYPVGHEIIGAEIADLNVWLVERLVS
ncbi:alpha/beta hydrolase [Novacetimonas hansenii]|uniref:alpha/beta hydrolase n=1 Tax=Novacetimonas hansenii TaxID=436 RepID=UPI000789B52B|nr:carboxylesterase [Novacetimonas hansenii]RFO99771.1 carboxylesterase [Novacetimonas hansenii]WEQ58302.1 carboxylesterase [Novacetimonas hansenii]CUW48556.1 Carboxylesterase 2 [Novacetimonas hansenii]